MTNLTNYTFEGLDLLPKDMTYSELVTELCGQVGIQHSRIVFWMIGLHVASSMIENKIKRSKLVWMSKVKFKMIEPIIMTKKPFVDIKVYDTDLRTEMNEMIVPIMKMVVYGCMVFLGWVMLMGRW